LLDQQEAFLSNEFGWKGIIWAIGSRACTPMGISGHFTTLSDSVSRLSRNTISPEKGNAKRYKDVLPIADLKMYILAADTRYRPYSNRSWHPCSLNSWNRAYPLSVRTNPEAAVTNSWDWYGHIGDRREADCHATTSRQNLLVKSRSF
jgi:hypothetical protein